MTALHDVQEQLDNVLDELIEKNYVKPNSLIVIGCSTSEVIGKAIGTAGSKEAAEIIFTSLKKRLSDTLNVQLAFQCCEHLNRAVIVERKTAEKYRLEEVTVIPVKEAGGSMATYAYQHFTDPVVVETIQADAGIDFGSTLIGMHLKHVAVPIRLSERKLGSAHITAAYTRPKLIGGARAVYE